MRVIFFILAAVVVAVIVRARQIERFSMQTPLGMPTDFLQGTWDGLVLDKAWHPGWPYDPTKGDMPETNFARNRFAWECCPEEPRNGQGCACLTPEQRWMMRTRGGNAV